MSAIPTRSPAPWEGAPSWRWRRGDFERMVELGVFPPTDRVELLQGVIVPMSPQGPIHAGLIFRGLEALLREGGGLRVRVQSPLACGDASLPEPDLCALDPQRFDRIDRHPDATEVELVIEISVSTQAVDRAKAQIYGAAGVPRYWLVDVAERRVWVHEEPHGDGYRRVLILDETAELPLPRGGAVQARALLP